MLQSAAIGAGSNPRFGGGRYRLPGFFCISTRKPISRDKPRKTNEFKESWDVTPPALFLLHPPLCPCNKKHAVVCNMKNTPDLALKPAPKTGLPGTSNSRHRDTFRKLRFGKLL